MVIISNSRTALILMSTALVANIAVFLLRLYYLVPSWRYQGITFDDDQSLASALFYMSFVTPTSTGYGDIVPVHPLARSLCNIDSVIGQLYPATLLARLVTLELRGPSQ
jgi:hypothetical protein